MLTRKRDQDFIISPEDAQLARRKRRMIVIGSLVLVLAILFGVFGTRPTGHAIRAWQARRHAQKAFAFINKEQWTDARSEAMAAYQLSPGQPEALRAVARYLTRLHSIEALDFWKELSKKTSLTRLDVRDEAMIAIIAGDIALADTAYTPTDRLTRRTGRLAARSATGDPEKSAGRSKILPGRKSWRIRARQKANSSGQRCCNSRLRPTARASGQMLLHAWEN